jgi:N-acetylglucosaminyldiphosphoundecaprenol N-acetyl-beta-D-mannosaminyltransferase
MKFFFSNKNPEQIIKRKEKKIFNFINLNTIWWLKNNEFYKNLMLQKQNVNFPDGKVLSWFLGIKQQRGPTFTKEFLLSDDTKRKKHFFIGFEKKDLVRLFEITDIPLKNLFCYNPSYIKGMEFSESERRKIISLINKSKAEYVWVCVGSPKQEILANQIFKAKARCFFNVGAATDFLLGKKKESPFIFRKSGLEWFYRFVTDFKYSKKKVWRSFLGFWILVSGGLRLIK